jgi:hypothetical protein
MSDRYRLVALGNDELVASLFVLVKRENGMLAEMLAHLAELDSRRLYLELGFPSMFAYCTEALGLCKSSAYRRIAAARVCRRFPEVFAHVAAGQLQMSVLAALSRFLTPENAGQLFADCSGKSCDQVEELLAIRFPRPDVPDSVRRLPERVMGASRAISASVAEPSFNGRSPEAPQTDGAVNLEPAAFFPLVSSMGNPNAAAPRSVAGAGPSPGSVAPVAAPALAANSPVQRKLEPLAADRFGVHFTADGDFKRLLEEVRALASHRLPNGDLSSLMVRALAAYRRELLKERYGVGRRAKRPKRVSVNPSEIMPMPVLRSRRVPAAVAREVYLRDGGCCTFCAANGQRCGATQFLQLDHITPWAVGGESTVANLRLRCRAHNQHAARSHFGTDYVEAAVGARRARLTSRNEGHGCAATACAKESGASTSFKNEPRPSGLSNQGKSRANDNRSRSGARDANHFTANQQPLDSADPFPSIPKSSLAILRRRHARECSRGEPRHDAIEPLTVEGMTALEMREFQGLTRRPGPPVG